MSINIMLIEKNKIKKLFGDDKDKPESTTIP
jgi:hypothetical protein